MATIPTHCPRTALLEKSTAKGELEQQVKGQDKIFGGQDFDSGCRSTYSAYVHDTPLLETVRHTVLQILPLCSKE